MNILNKFLSISILAVFTSCGIQSINPFYTEDDLIENENIIGVWTTEKNDETWTFSITNEEHYLLSHEDEYGKSSLVVGLMKFEGEQFIDLSAREEGNQNYLGAWHTIPVHTLAKIKIKEHKITLSFFGGEEFQDMLLEGKYGVSFIIPGQEGASPILTGSTQELQKLLSKNMKNAGLFSEELVLTRN